MKPLFFLFISLISLSTFSSCGSDSGSTVEVTIPMGAMGLGASAFGQNPLTVQAGTTVKWINSDTMAHTSTSDSGVWDSGSIAAGSSYSYKFPSAGTFPYHCTIHGVVSMSGSITVTGTSSGY